MKLRPLYVVLFVLAASALCLGCGKSVTPLETKQPEVLVIPPLPGVNFRPSECGLLVGTVTWSGPVPPRGESFGARPDGDKYETIPRPDAFFLDVDAKTNGLAHVLVMLDLQDVTKAKQWTYLPPRIVAQDYLWQAYQGDSQVPGPLLARLGEELTLVNQDPELHVVRGRGAEFFSLSFPSRLTRTVTLQHTGVVELTSGAGYHWLAHDLFVSAHPYVAVTDKTGKFQLADVPAGEYRIQFGVRNPQVLTRERDPETGLPFRTIYAPAFTQEAQVTITAGKITEQNITFRATEK